MKINKGDFSIKNIDDCKSKKSEIERSIKSTLSNANIVDYGTIAHTFDLSGKSKVTVTVFWLGSDFVRTECTIWSDEIKNGYPDWENSLSLTAGRGEVNQWFNDGYK